MGNEGPGYPNPHKVLVESYLGGSNSLLVCHAPSKEGRLGTGGSPKMTRGSLRKMEVREHSYHRHIVVCLWGCCLLSLGCVENEIQEPVYQALISCVQIHNGTVTTTVRMRNRHKGNIKKPQLRAFLQTQVTKSHKEEIHPTDFPLCCLGYLSH